MINFPVNIGNIVTRVLTVGQSGPVVVLVHGFGAKADRWTSNLDAIAAAGFRAFAFDLPGHGFATKGEAIPCRVPQLADFLRAVLDHFGIDKAFIVGTSLGGAVVASFCAANPERVQGAVFVGSMGLVPIGEEIRGRISAGSHNQSREAMATKFKVVICDQSLVKSEMIEEEYQINNSDGANDALKAYGRYIGSDLDKDVAGPQLVNQKFRKLLVWGDQDKVVPLSFGQAARKLLPDSQLVIIEGTSHTPYFERSADFNPILVSFLQNEPLPQPAGVVIA
jgi:2-hydroxy-6-oxonona-2,4-dienedioate hydrolase